jgi:hypothetical protein
MERNQSYQMLLMTIAILLLITNVVTNYVLQSETEDR